MRYQRTQIYLDPEQHAKLVAEARERGISLAALLREIVTGHVEEKAPAYDARSWDAIVAIGGDEGEPTDIALYKDQYIGEAMDLVYEKKMGRKPPKPRKPNR
jgi:hypothetical protein